MKFYVILCENNKIGTLIGTPAGRQSRKTAQNQGF